jgi:aspartate-semialdehyde dehydrogenase
VLKALHDLAGLRGVVATTFQSVSGAGQKGVAALHAELAGGTASDSPFSARIAGNAVPAIGPRDDAGWNEEERKMRAETRKILDLPDLEFSATCVRVPVEVGHSVSAAVRLARPVSKADAERALRAMRGVVVPESDPTPLDCADSDEVLVGRIRVDPDVPGIVHVWVVADNLRKGAATNAVQIAETVAGVGVAGSGAGRVDG